METNGNQKADPVQLGPPGGPGQGAEAIYDDINNKLDIPAVDYQGLKYRILLKSKGVFIFTVKEVIALPAPQ